MSTYYYHLRSPAYYANIGEANNEIDFLFSGQNKASLD